MKAKYHIDPHEIRTYFKQDSCVFKKNNDEFGALSNMASGFPLRILGVEIKTTEALYQACRFPHLPELQREIIMEKSPMSVKMISNSNKKESRGDWTDVRLKVMRWCLQVKLAQNFVSFGSALHQTGLKNIVEKSSSDNFWGAIPNEDETLFVGKNALGRLLMDLRQSFYGRDNFSLLFVKAPSINEFKLYNESIGVVDERVNFINWLINYWTNLRLDEQLNSSNLELDSDRKDIYLYSSIYNLGFRKSQEKASNIVRPHQRKKGDKRKGNDTQPDLFSDLDT